ncbi:RNA-directed DNA polymerase from mobile element jockey [Anthophora quadrimaculata]
MIVQLLGSIVGHEPAKTTAKTCDSETNQDKENSIETENFQKIIKIIKKKGLSQKCLEKAKGHFGVITKSSNTRKRAPTPNINKIKRISRNQTNMALTKENQHQLPLSDAMKVIEELKKTIEELTKQLKEEREKNQKETEKVPKPTRKPTENLVSSMPTSQTPTENGRLKANTGKRPHMNPTANPSTGNRDLQAVPSTSHHQPPPSAETLSPSNKRVKIHTDTHATIPHKISKPPPISIIDTPCKISIDLITKITKNFYTKKINQIKHLVYIEDIDAYKKTCDTLKQNNIQFYTYTPRMEKNISILIKNLDGNFEPEIILEELRSKNIAGLKFSAVKKFETRKSIAEGKTLPIYIVQLSPDSKIENLRQIKVVLHSLISWEKIIKKDRVQCKRCQRIGHIALNCNLNYRCVKCNTPHNPGECTRERTAESKPYCVNCKSFGHPASYRGCPKLTEMRQTIENKLHRRSNRYRILMSHSHTLHTPPNNKLTLTHINIIQINVNSIITNERRISLQDCINTHNPDILLLSETKLNQRHKIDFRNYTTIRTDRPNAKQAGGTAIIIKEEIAFKHVTTQTTTCFESTIIEIKLQNAAKLYVVAGYATSSCKKEFMIEFKQIFHQLELQNDTNYYILAGDLNAKHRSWDNVINNSRGISLNKWILENEIPYRISLYKTETPSFPKSGAFIDLCIADNRIKFHNTPNHRSLESFPYDSDHRAVKIQISIPTMQTLEIDETVTQNRYNFKQADWIKFKNYLIETDGTMLPNNRNLTIDEIDEYIDKLSDNINNAIDHATPQIPKNSNSTDKYITPLIKRLRKQKSYILTQINRLTKPENYTRANDILITAHKDTLKIIRNELRKAFHASVNDFWKKKISSITPHNSSKFFPTINNIFRHKDSNNIETLKIPKTNTHLFQKAKINPNSQQTDSQNNVLITDTEQKLNILGAHFETVHTQNQHMGKQQLTNIIKQKIITLKQEILEDRSYNKTICTFSNTNTADNPDEDKIPPDYFTSHTKLILTLKKLNNKKSSSFDNIPNIAFKNLPLLYSYNYTIIFNNCLNYTYFPTAWKTAKIIAIKKKGKDGSNPSDYRPISLLANISKIFETTINNAIAKHSETNNVIPETQFGFRHKHSTTHAITKFISDICWARNAGDCVGALLVDLEKAFDTVWWEGLFFKLMKKGFPQHLTKMIWSMLHGKKFRVAKNSHASTEIFEVKNGLQQGTVNSPILFSIFISDLLNMYGLNNDTDKFAIAFADDLLIYTKDSKPSKIKTQLQDIFTKIQDYFHTWRLKINTDKCETILFRPYISKISDANADNKNIVRYLGVNIDYRLNYYNHINIQIEKAQKAFANHKRLFYCKDLNTETKLICYKTLIRPILTYACPTWFNISASTMEKLRIFERKCLRACIGKYRTPESNYTKLISNHKLYEHANTIRIDLHILKHIRNHWASIRNVKNNSLINSSIYPHTQYHEKTRHTGYIPPEAFIHLDTEGYIQDKDNIPLIYHITRKADNKTILYNTDINQNSINSRQNLKLSNIDKKDRHRRNTKKYWWLSH